ncbi:UV-damage endonuclease [Alteribacillus persepolensis]|uniref:UV DNA damage endonuclease n=1 Tax=Alteribacillus persepolensis TaxID=568899 RepID=A0A1G7Z6K8_9BACI|nr:UV DNA damage repair endonuclease UvsE [Alteribacillus persepolensis]SDH04239.1 UV-damage endonuclease [Alteribacillus persepolensis]
MIIRIGYVSHATSLWDASPSKTLTFTRWKNMKKDERNHALHDITRKNLQHTLRALHFNIAHEIRLYRFSSAIVPLATHEEVNWDYITPFRSLYKEIGTLVHRHHIRTSFHPNQFTLFTSDKPHVTENAVNDMTYHYHLLEAMGLLDTANINIHVGGAYGNKQAAVERFHQNLQLLPAPVKQQMTLENDDKTYTTTETLSICEKEGIPMMFDYHHYKANAEPNETLETILPRFFHTWSQSNNRPKIHVSSPKSAHAYRSHADYVDAAFVAPLINALKQYDVSVDMMVEAKQKDKACLQLTKDLASMRGIKRAEGAVLRLS